MMSNLRVKIIKVRDDAFLPSYQTKYAAGMDLHACLDAPLTMNMLDRLRIPTGIAVELPVGYELQIRARSSFGLKYGVTMANGVGTIDSDYRGELSVVLINLSKEPFIVEPGMRIAQMIVARHEHVVWDEVKSLSETERAKGGFGSTGTTVSVDAIQK
jgi:dUTP pyrophosphatase